MKEKTVLIQAATTAAVLRAVFPVPTAGPWMKRPGQRWTRDLVRIGDALGLGRDTRTVELRKGIIDSLASLSPPPLSSSRCRSCSSLHPWDLASLQVVQTPRDAAMMGTH